MSGRHGDSGERRASRGRTAGTGFVCQGGPFKDFGMAQHPTNPYVWNHYGQLLDGRWVLLERSPVEMGLVASEAQEDQP